MEKGAEKGARKAPEKRAGHIADGRFDIKQLKIFNLNNTKMKKLILSLVALAGVMTVSAQSGVAEAYNNGAAALNAKNYAEAAKLFEHVVDEGITSEDATVLQQVENAKKYVVTCYRNLGMGAAKTGEYDAAVGYLNTAAERAEEYGNAKDKATLNGLLSKVYQAQGGAAFNDKNYAKAAAIFEKGYEANPRNTQMANWLGTCYCEMGEFDKGIEVLSKVAADKAPRAAEDAAEAKRLIALYTNNRVAELQGAGDTAGIIAMADNMLAADAQNATAHKVRLQAYFGANNFDKVIEYGEAAAAAQENDEDKSDVYFTLGAAYNAKEMKPQAIAAMQKVTAGGNVAAAKATIAELSK